jgi:1-acyl-sn-glycerol-3-phosphate acyltransferase
LRGGERAVSKHVDLTYPPVILAAKTGFRVLGQKIRITGDHHVPRQGGVLLAVNHIGYVDFVYGGLAANPSGRKVRFMSKRELFDHRWSGPLMRSLHHIEVDRADGEASLATAVEYLRAGEAVGIFPEATISRALELKEFKTGAVRIAAAAEVPLVPVILWGTQRMMTKDHPRDFSRGKTISVSVGTPLHPTGEDPAAETAELHRVMSSMLDEAIRAYPAAEQPEGCWWLPQRYGGSAPSLDEAARMDVAEKAERAAKRAARDAEKGTFSS